MTKLERGTIIEQNIFKTRYTVIAPDKFRSWDDNVTCTDSDHSDELYTVIGRLPPDQLDATEWRDEYRLPPLLDEEEHYWNGTQWVVRLKEEKLSLEPGLVVAFGSETCVIMKREADKRWGCRQLNEPGEITGELYDTDDLKVLGRIPLDQLYTATEIPKAEHEERQPEKLVADHIGQAAAQSLYDLKEQYRQENADLKTALVREHHRADDLKEKLAAQREQNRERTEKLSEYMSKSISIARHKEELAIECRAREAAEEARNRAIADMKATDDVNGRLIKAFRTATGQEYEPGRDYLKTGTVKTEKIPLFSELPIGAVFTLCSANNATKWKKCSKNKARGNYSKCNFSDADRIYSVISIPAQKEAKMSFFKVAPKFLGKYGALFVLFTLLSSPVATYNAVAEWWNAPTPLQLGDWTMIDACKDCSAFVDEEALLCPKCGGEEIEAKKAQTLYQDSIKESWSGVRGYVFEDGSTTLEPGHWKVPERIVEVTD